jgi:hypothetical protein
MCHRVRHGACGTGEKGGTPLVIGMGAAAILLLLFAVLWLKKTTFSKFA